MWSPLRNTPSRNSSQQQDAAEQGTCVTVNERSTYNRIMIDYLALLSDGGRLFYCKDRIVNGFAIKLKEVFWIRRYVGVRWLFLRTLWKEGEGIKNMGYEFYMKNKMLEVM